MFKAVLSCQTQPILKHDIPFKNNPLLSLVKISPKTNNTLRKQSLKSFSKSCKPQTYIMTNENMELEPLDLFPCAYRCVGSVRGGPSVVLALSSGCDCHYKMAAVRSKETILTITWEVNCVAHRLLNLQTRRTMGFVRPLRLNQSRPRSRLASPELGIRETIGLVFQTLKNGFK